MTGPPGRSYVRGVSNAAASPGARSWWISLIVGLVALLGGILAIAYPDLTLLAIGLFAGVSLLFVGAMELVDAITGDADSRVYSMIVGLLALIAGTVCLRRPGESLLALVVVLGLYLCATGVIRFVRSLSVLDDRPMLMGLAIIDVILGVLILALPKLSLATLGLLFALSLIARGVVSIVVGFRMRGVGRHGPEATAPA
jgi:uncharacterized membrane protein HdeD (DUF308 family)